MFGRLFRRESEDDAIAARLYGAIVAQARNPALYTYFGVPDTVTGRFEMVVLHLILILDRLQHEGEAEKALGQRIFDLYCTDIDRSLRELGIGDLGVPKRMKKMTEAFYGRASAYRDALTAGDAARLGEAIARNAIPNGDAASGRRLADYALASFAALGAAPLATLRAGNAHFAAPAASAPSGASAEAVG